VKKIITTIFKIILLSWVYITSGYAIQLGTYHTEAVISPGNGSVWVYDTFENVLWDSSSISGSTVNLYVLYDDPSDINDTAPDTLLVENKNWGKFASDISNSGTYSVNPRVLNGIGDAYKILVVSDNMDWGMSQGTFELTEGSIPKVPGIIMYLLF